MPLNTTFPMRKRPASKRAAATVDFIIEAAEEQLKARPYEAFNTNDVARRAGVSVGTLYQYFSSKEAIIAELRIRIATRIQSETLSVLIHADGMTPKEVIRGLVRAHLEVMAEDTKLYSILFLELCEVGVAPDFESRVNLAPDPTGSSAALQEMLRRLAIETYGDSQASPILLGAWGLLRVMSTVALMEGRLANDVSDLESEITQTIVAFIDQRIASSERVAE